MLGNVGGGGKRRKPCGSEGAVVTEPVPNFTRLDPSLPEIAILMHAMLRAREVVAARSWSTSQEPTSEHWWADVLADPRARQRRVLRGLHTYSGGRMLERAYYTLADEPRPTILVACSKCPWQAAFSRAELVSNYGPEYPMPNLLDHLAMPGCVTYSELAKRCRN
jgi:hypothetical protein